MSDRKQFLADLESARTQVNAVYLDAQKSVPRSDMVSVNDDLSKPEMEKLVRSLRDASTSMNSAVRRFMKAVAHAS